MNNQMVLLTPYILAREVGWLANRNGIKAQGSSRRNIKPSDLLLSLNAFDAIMEPMVKNLSGEPIHDFDGSWSKYTHDGVIMGASMKAAGDEIELNISYEVIAH